MQIAYTPGEPAGIGPDLAIINAQRETREARADLLVFSDPDMLLQRAKVLGLPLKIVQSEGILKRTELNVFPIKARVKTQHGVLNPDNAPFVLETLNIATEHCLKSHCSALLTGPIHKGIINQAGIPFSGHTEYLAALSNTPKTVMMLATKGLRVALATTHLPLSAVPQHISADSLQQTLAILQQFLLSQNIKRPTISVCGLNPHAGEDGYLGDEEITIINPLIKRLNQQNYHLIGAIPADTAFTPDALKGIDCVLAMYHDQGLPVLKTIGFKQAVNITLGLPFIRTSVDHGTALHLAGTGNISLGSFDYALACTQTLLRTDRLTRSA